MNTARRSLCALPMPDPLLLCTDGIHQICQNGPNVTRIYDVVSAASGCLSILFSSFFLSLVVQGIINWIEHSKIIHHKQIFTVLPYGLLFYSLLSSSSSPYTDSTAVAAAAVEWLQHTAHYLCVSMCMLSLLKIERELRVVCVAHTFSLWAFWLSSCLCLHVFIIYIYI